jgi:hypothetical protein
MSNYYDSKGNYKPPVNSYGPYDHTGENWWQRYWLALLGAGLPITLILGILWGAWHLAHLPPADVSACGFRNAEMVTSKLTGERGQIISTWPRKKMCLYSVRWAETTTEHVRPYELEKIK